MLDISCLESEDTRGAIERLQHEAVLKVRDGAELLVLSDRTAYEGDRRYLDPHLALAAVDLALREAWVEPAETNLRRRCGIVLRSAALRNVHDVVLALGLGADGVCPYVMVEVALMDDYRQDIDHLCAALRKGIEKVISTIGIHEVRGYARLFSSIGLKPELDRAASTRPAGRAASARGVGYAELDRDGDERQRILAGHDDSKPAKTFRFYPKVYKAAIAAADGGGELRGLLEARARARAGAAHLAAPHPRPALRPRAGARDCRARRGAPLLPDRDQLDELRLAGRDRLPRLRRGGEAGQHHRHERRGRRDPGHVRPLPASGAASRLHPAASASRAR